MLTVERREKKHNEVGPRKAWEHVTVESFSCRMLNDCVPRKACTREDISPAAYLTRLTWSPCGSTTIVSRINPVSSHGEHAQWCCEEPWKV